MKISDLRGLLSDKRVMEEIHRHLWIESQKAGYNIGVERATDEWLRLYSEGWVKYHMPDKYETIQAKNRREKGKKIKAESASKAKSKRGKK